MNYVPIKVRTDASLLMSPSKPKTIVKRLSAINCDACAITNNATLSDTIGFVSELESANKKPIIGVVVNVSSEDASIKNEANEVCHTITLLAKNTQGWKNLLKIVSLSNSVDNYYNEPRLSLDQMKPYLNNLIGMSGAIGSTLHYCISEWGVQGGVKCASILKDCFDPNSFYLEVCLVDIESRILSQDIRVVSQLSGIPTVGVINSFYTSKEEADLQRILLCSNMRKNFKDALDSEYAHFFTSEDYYIPSYDEMVNEYGYSDTELQNTIAIGNSIEKYDILHSPFLKEYECPNGLKPDQYLRELCREGYKNLLAGKLNSDEAKIYGERANQELEILLDAGLASYFLIVADILNYCRQNNWLVGPGRGSAAGCLVSYLIGITKVDPIKHNLLFERFYSASRNTDGNISLPDIDIDIPTQYRDNIIEYVKNKYGHENVAQMITYQTMQGSKTLKEVFSAYDDVKFEEINLMTKNIVAEAKIADDLQHMKETTGESSIIRWCLENIPKEFEDWARLEDGKIVGPYADRFEKAIKLEGTKASQSRHPAGIIVCPFALDTVCPLVYDTKQHQTIVAFEMEDAEKAGLMKLDLLGVSILDKIMMVRDLLKRRGIDFDGDISKMSMDDEKTWNLISDGNTKGIWQLESQLGQGMSKKLKPRNIDHLAALTALLRPGCLESELDDGKSVTEHYCMRKNGIEDVTYVHESLKPILKHDYGMMIYQEHAIKIGQELAGMSGADADKYIRKGIGKKKPELIAKAKTIFLEGTKNKGIINDEIAETIFSWIEASQRYSFNASILDSTVVTTTDNVEKTIAELQVGEEILCPSGTTTVVNKFDHGLQPVYEVELEDGKKITCTMEHKFLCDTGEILSLRDIIDRNLSIVCQDGV